MFFFLTFAKLSCSVFGRRTKLKRFRHSWSRNGPSKTSSRSVCCIMLGYPDFETIFTVHAHVSYVLFVNVVVICVVFSVRWRPASQCRQKVRAPARHGRHRLRGGNRWVVALHVMTSYIINWATYLNYQYTRRLWSSINQIANWFVNINITRLNACAEIQKMKQEVVKEIRANQQLEHDLNEMDIKIGLLVKNRITLQVRVARTHELFAS